MSSIGSISVERHLPRVRRSYNKSREPCVLYALRFSDFLHRENTCTEKVLKLKSLRRVPAKAPYSRPRPVKSYRDQSIFRLVYGWFSGVYGFTIFFRVIEQKDTSFFLTQFFIFLPTQLPGFQCFPFFFCRARQRYNRIVVIYRCDGYNYDNNNNQRKKTKETRFEANESTRIYFVPRVASAGALRIMVGFRGGRG